MLSKLMYAMLGIRPDIAYSVGKLARFSHNPLIQHWSAMTHLYGYMRKTQGLELRYDGGMDTVDFHGYTDADFAGDLDTRRSTSGYLWMMCNGAISWGARRQNIVTTSTTQAEYYASNHTGKEEIWLQSLLFSL